MHKADPLIRTKLHRPLTRLGLVSRPRLQEQIILGLCGPLTLITAPAGFGKTTLVASCVSGCGMPVAWLSLDKNDNLTGRFLSYLIAALQEADNTIGGEAARLLSASEEALPETILTNLINDLDIAQKDIILVLDDYQFISSQGIHDSLTFLLDHCPLTLHLVIATRSDPPLPLARLRARGQTVELRAADLRFTEPEAAQFLNEVMGLGLDTGAVTVLEERTEGWIAGLQMASIALRSHLSMPGQKDIITFIEGFSGTNRYILDYLLEEVLASQPPEIQRFLLHTSILERLTAPLCDAILASDDGSHLDNRERAPRLETLATRRSSSMLDYLERANLFLVPLDDERVWYRYHHLFANLLRTELQKSLGVPGVARLHERASEWYDENGSALEAIYHASLASDFERVEQLIEQHYIEMMNRGEMSWIRQWMGKLSKTLIYQRPWLCLYEAFSRSWFGQLDEAVLLLDEAEKLIRSEEPSPGTRAMLGYHTYVRSRVTAMQGDTLRAISYCLSARDQIPADNLGLQIEMSITLGYEYFLVGDFLHARPILDETIRTGYTIRAVNNPVAASAILARIDILQGQLHDAYDLFQKAAKLLQDAGAQYLGAMGLVEVGTAALLYEWNETGAAHVRVKQGLDNLPWWGKVDDLVLAYTTLSRILLAQGHRAEAADAIDKAAQLIQPHGVFSEARSEVEAMRVKMWLVRADYHAAGRWAAEQDRRFDPHDAIRFEDELAHLARARVWIAQGKPEKAIRLLSALEELAQSCGRTGRLIEILILKALATLKAGDTARAEIALAKSLALAEPNAYTRVYLDEGPSMQSLLAQWLAKASAGPLRDYAVHLFSQFDAELVPPVPAREETSADGEPVEPLSQRELEVLHLMALGKTNQQIARQLVVAAGTIKAHAASIYRKLDVNNRTEAVARARILGILP